MAVKQVFRVLEMAKIQRIKAVAQIIFLKEVHKNVYHSQEFSGENWFQQRKKLSTGVIVSVRIMKG